MRHSQAVDKRIPSLDGLRALSVAFVIFGHYLLSWPRYAGIMAALAIFGVHIFFVVSGYVITTLLQKEQEASGRISLRAFYRRRTFRIFPAAFAYMLIMAAVYPAVRVGLPWALTYTVSYHSAIPPMYGHLWSLSIEEQFYLLWPLALVLGYRYRARIAWMAIVGAFLFRLALAFTPYYAGHTAHYTFPATMDSIAAGCLLAIYEVKLRERIAKLSGELVLVVGLPIAAFAIHALVIANSFHGNRRFDVLWPAVPLLIAFWVGLLVARKDWVLNNPFTYWTGALSYSLYLWHGVWLSLHWPLLPSLALIAATAAGSYFIIEQPMIQLGKGPRQPYGPTANAPI